LTPSLRKPQTANVKHYEKEASAVTPTKVQEPESFVDEREWETTHEFGGDEAMYRNLVTKHGGSETLRAPREREQARQTVS